MCATFIAYYKLLYNYDTKIKIIIKIKLTILNLKLNYSKLKTWINYYTILIQYNPQIYIMTLIIKTCGNKMENYVCHIYCLLQTTNYYTKNLGLDWLILN